MTTQNDGWIKMSTRKPTAAEYQIGITLGRWSGEQWQTSRDWHNDSCLGNYTHFYVQTIPAPPAKELTQRERDDLACEESEANAAMNLDRRSWFGIGWHAALAYRDKQNAEDLVKMANLIANPFVKSLRRRCGLDS